MLKKRKSKIHGKGISTTSAIEKEREFYKIPQTNIYSEPQKKCAKIGNIWIDDNKVLNWVNHSCCPNSKINLRNKSLIAVRKIKPNEEITLDYNKTEKNGTKVKCRCKCKNCRGYFLRVE